MKRLGSLTIVAACVLLAACSGSEVKGDGKVVMQSRSAGTFDEISTNGNFVVTVNAQQGSPSVQVKVDQNLQPYVVTQVKDDELMVSVKKGFEILPTKPVQVFVSTKELSSAKVNGEATFMANNLSGKHFELKVNGTANSVLKGQVDATQIDINGSSQVNASGLKSENVAVNVNGEGKVSVYVSSKLKVNIKGEGQVTYFGKPPVIEQAIYGGGQLIKGK